MTSFATSFVTKIISDAVSNILRTSSRFNTILSKSGFGFKKHQLDGVMWCVQNETRTFANANACKGGIVADEMGLGKTVIMIGTM